MLYAISESYFIDLSEIAHIRCEANPEDDAKRWPYRMYIRMKDGQVFVTRYSDKRHCQVEIDRIVNMRNRLTPEPVTRYELEQVMRNEVERLKRYIHKSLESVKGEVQRNEQT